MTILLDFETGTQGPQTQAFSSLIKGRDRARVTFSLVFEGSPYLKKSSHSRQRRITIWKIISNVIFSLSEPQKGFIPWVSVAKLPKMFDENTGFQWPPNLKRLIGLESTVNQPLPVLCPSYSNGQLAILHGQHNYRCLLKIEIFVFELTSALYFILKLLSNPYRHYSVR